jgi:Protein of unknown function (DUF4240)
MKEDQFWTIIEAAKLESEGDAEAQLEAMQTELNALEPADIMEFQRLFDQFHRVSYRADLWGAAYIMNGGASDDGFDYFRGWLIAQGKKVFEAALESPDSLSDVVPDDAEADFGFENEDILNLGTRAWVEKTGLDADAFYQRLGPPERLPALGEFEWGDGEGDIDKQKGEKQYPKLWKKFDDRGRSPRIERQKEGFPRDLEGPTLELLGGRDDRVSKSVERPEMACGTR